MKISEQGRENAELRQQISELAQENQQLIAENERHTGSPDFELRIAALERAYVARMATVKR